MTCLSVRREIFHLATRMRMQAFHFASGAYPVSEAVGSYPVNRLFLVMRTGGAPDADFIADGHGRTPLEEHGLYLIPAMWRTAWTLSEDLRFISVHFTLSDVSDLDVFSASQRIFRLDDRALELELIDAWNEPDAFVAAAKLKALLYRFCGVMFERFPESRIDASEKFREFHDTVEYIERNCSARMGVAELAERVGMRPDVFSRKFAAAVGMPPKRWLTRALVRKAGDLLMRRMSARRTAESLGFCNEFYFSRFFKEHTGMSTLRFRREYAEKQRLPDSVTGRRKETPS